jgi:hypothetical protein
MAESGGVAYAGPRDRLVLLGVIAFLLAASAAPYWVASRATPLGWSYAGSSEASLDDYPSYLVKMRAGARGDFVYRSPYSPALQETIQVRPFYAAIGALTHLVTDESWLGYHAARLAMGALCLWLVFYVAGAVSRGALERWSAFLLATLGSGLGWWVGREGPRIAWSYDLWVPELNVFHSLLTNPHFPLSIVLMLSTLVGVARALDTGRLRYAAFGGAAVGLLSLVHPYDDFALAGALALYGLGALVAGRHSLRQLVSVGLVLSLAALPGVAWMAASYASDASLANMGNAQPVGPIWRVFCGLGLLLPLALFGLGSLAGRASLGGLLAAWALVVPLLMLLPLEFPRRMVGGWQVPLGIASGLALAKLVAPLGRRGTRRSAVAAAVVIVFASLSSFDIALSQIRSFSNPGKNLFPIHHPPDLIEAFAWLQAQGSAGDVVLAPYGPSNWLPVYTDLRPYFGHWAEAPDRHAREAARDSFYRGRGTREARQKFLRDNRIAWIFAGPLFRQPGYVAIDPARDGATRAHRVGGIDLLRVDPRVSDSVRSRGTDLPASP